ncbi:MAG: flagellar basal body-associated FliL family protein [Lachnospiraceae bacterium]|nr:flagellar basal body-associated FliL family protein [Lachnospiraceae bacterium]
MKKNMLLLIIVALLVVNIALTGIMMFSVLSTSSKTSKLIDGITTALNIETGGEEGEDAASIPVSSIAVYNIADPMTILLKKVPETEGGDGKDHYCVVSVSLSLNSESPDYKTYGEGDLTSYEALIKDSINSVISGYTMEDARNNQDQMKAEILEKVRGIFSSDFVLDISFRDIMFQ